MLFRACSMLPKSPSSAAHSEDADNIIVEEVKTSAPQQRISLARGSSAGIATVRQSSYEVEIEEEDDDDNGRGSTPSAVPTAQQPPRPYSTSTLLRPHMSLRELLLPSSSSSSLLDNNSPKGSGVFSSSMSIDQRTSSFRVRSINKKGSASIMNLIFPISSRNTQVEQGRQLFMGFLQRCYSVEVLEFWDGTSKYIYLAKQPPNTTSTRHVDLAKLLINEYLLPDSKQKLDLGWEIEDPLIEAYYGRREFTAGSFDSCRKLLFKLMLGLKMDANVSYGGAKTPSGLAIATFLDEEERKMHQMRFQRDVHPLLHLLRRNTTVEGRGSALGV